MIFYFAGLYSTVSTWNIKIKAFDRNLKNISIVNLLLNVYSLSNCQLSVILIHEIFSGTGETEGETSVDKTAKISCQTPIAKRRSKCIYQTTERKHAKY